MAASAPTKLGRYEIVEELGKGAMGVVYLAKDPLIGRLVALKTFRVGYSAQDEELQQFRERFIREAQSAGILSHPNIVTIHDVVESSEEGVTFIAMEYVRGTNLKELLQGSVPLETDFIVDVTAQVADALDFAHDKGVVHRDVKPANILITGDRRVKIADFGIARLNTSNLTFDGQLLGTPNYMAPEQIQGKEVDHRADIFSLGVVLYELLTRKKPFAGESLTVVTHRIVHEAFTPPEELVADLPEALRAVLRRALEKDPERRFARASQMAEDLRKSRAPNLNDTLSTFVSARTQRIETRAVPPPAPPPAAAVAPPPAPRAARAEAGASIPTPPMAAPPPLPEVALPELSAPPPAPGIAAAGPPAATVPVAETPAAAAAAAKVPAVASRDSAQGFAKAAGTSQETTVAIPGRASGKAAARPARAPLPGAARSVIAALAGLALVCLLGVAALWLRSRSAPPPPSLASVPAAAPAPLSPARAQLGEGTRLLATGDAAGAVLAFAEAERLEPALAEARSLRLAAEARVQADLQAAERARVVDAALAAGRAALQRRRFDDAKAAAEQVLLLLPAHPEALSLQAQAEQGLRRRERGAAPEADAAESPVAPAVATAPDPAAPAAPARTDATLALDFYTEVPKGSITIYLNDQQLSRQSFRFARRINRFRSEAQPGGLVERHTIAAGEARLRVIVALDGKPTRVIQAAGSFPGGSTRTLVVRVDAEGNATGTLQQ